MMGCASFVPSHRTQRGTPQAILALADLPATESESLSRTQVTGRNNLEPEVDDELSEGEAEEPLSTARNYWRLTPDECACRAAQKTPIAGLIELEKQIVAGRKSHTGADQSQLLQQTLLSLRATDLRNQAAGQALELYYKLVEVESGRDAAARSIRLVDAAIKDLTELQRRGLTIDVDEFDLKQQRLELVERQQELARKSDEINRQLKLLLDAAGIGPPIWPGLKLRVVFGPLDAEAAVTTGVETRADLTMLRLLAATVDAKALATARSALRQRESSLGNQSATLRDMLQILQSKRGERELRIRQRQLAALLETHYKTVSAEIRGSAAQVLARREQIRLSKRKLDQRRRRLSDLKKQQRVGGATIFDIFRERMEIIRVESELMKHVVAWKIAQSNLKQAQGLLAEECGFGRASVQVEPAGAIGCISCVADTRGLSPTGRSRRRRLHASDPTDPADP